MERRPKTIEPKWQQVWEAESPETPNPAPGEETDERHWYQLEMLRPSGTLHMGHVLNYTMGDVVTSPAAKRLEGPAADGLRLLRPAAENAAITEGGHPREITERNIAAIREQMKRLGWVIDWTREVSAHEVDYYRWTQWLFLKFFERGLALPRRRRQLVPERPDGRRERVRGRRTVRPVWGARRGADDGAVVLQDHRVRRRPARVRPARGRLVAGADEDDPAELDRPLEGAEILFRIDELDEDVPVFDAAGHLVRRDLLRPRS